MRKIVVVRHVYVKIIWYTLTQLLMLAKNGLCSLQYICRNLTIYYKLFTATC